MAERAPQSQDKFIVRLPGGMRERIKAAADANHRSMNAEIVARLEASLGPGMDELLPGDVQLTQAEEARMAQIMQSFADLLSNRSQNRRTED